MKRQLIIISLSFFILSCTQGQNISTTKFNVNGELIETIKEQTSSTNGVSMGKMEIKMYENDSLIIDTYDKEKKIEFFTMSKLENDTIRIIGFAGMFAGFGFYLDISKEDYNLTCLAKSDAPIYKYKKQDTTLTYGLSVPCSQTSLTITQKPTFKNGETIAGYLELISDDFWEESNGKEKKYKMELRAYFITDELKNK